MGSNARVRPAPRHVMLAAGLLTVLLGTGPARAAGGGAGRLGISTPWLAAGAAA